MEKVSFPVLLIIRFTWSNSLHYILLSWGKLRREPATQWFDESFAPISKFEDRFARQNPYELPPEFPLASPYSLIDHHLSGLSIYTFTLCFQHLVFYTVWNATFHHIDEIFFSLFTFITYSLFLLYIWVLLVYLLNSLARVTRRVSTGYFINIPFL